MLGLTGTPGTGKKTLAPLIGSTLGVPVLSINDLLIPAQAKKRAKAVEVDPARARRTIMRKVKGECLVYGHLLADVFQKTDLSRVVVLRCDPSMLKARLAARGYSEKKVRENVEAELIGLIATTARAKFGDGRVAEVDTSLSDAPTAAAAAASLLRGRLRVLPGVDWIESYSSALKLRSLLSARAARSPRT